MSKAASSCPTLGTRAAPRCSGARLQGACDDELRARVVARPGRRRHPREEVLDHLREMVAATELPVNADFESGFAPIPRASPKASGWPSPPAWRVSRSRTRRASRDPLPAWRSRSPGCARHAQPSTKAGGDSCWSDVPKTSSPADPTRRHDRAPAAYSEAGADCLYAPGIRTRAQIEAVVAAVAPKPVNLLVGWASDSRWRTSLPRRAAGQRRRRAGARRLGADSSRGPCPGRRGQVRRFRRRHDGRRAERLLPGASLSGILNGGGDCLRGEATVRPEPPAVAGLLSVLLHLLILSALARVASGSIDAAPPSESGRDRDKSSWRRRAGRSHRAPARPPAERPALLGQQLRRRRCHRRPAHRAHHPRRRRHSRIESRLAARRHRPQSSRLAGFPSGRRAASGAGPARRRDDDRVGASRQDLHRLAHSAAPTR